MPRERILIVDDESNARTALAELLRDEGYAVETAADGFKALPKLEDFQPDVVVTDLKMPGLSGLELMQKVRERDPEGVVIVMTAFGAVESAVQAMRQGAADYLTKPVNVDELSLVLKRELERKRLRAEAGQLRERLSEKHRIDNIIGSSPAMSRCSTPCCRWRRRARRCSSPARAAPARSSSPRRSTSTARGPKSRSSSCTAPRSPPCVEGPPAI